MPKDTIGRAFKNHFGDWPEACVMLGKTSEEIAKMDLRQFADLVYSKGYDVTCSTCEATSGERGKLTITTDGAASAAPTAS